MAGQNEARVAVEKMVAMKIVRVLADLSLRVR